MRVSRTGEQVTGTDASASAPDGAERVDGGGSPDDAGPATDARVFDPGPEPTSPLRPVPGEVTVIQLDLPAGITVRMGESAVIVGPDGTIVLLDVGNSNQYDAVQTFDAACQELPDVD